MKYLSEYRDARLVQGLAGEIKNRITQPWVIMEICGGQTHAIKRYGLDQLLPPEIELVHGPGCPVCVTSLELIDKALAIAAQPGVIFTSYGDMLRVPGSQATCSVFAPAEVTCESSILRWMRLELPQENPSKQVVFFAIGFETTAPANVMSVLQARNMGIQNFSVLVSHVRVPPAMHAILGSPYNRVQAFLAAGHVCAVMGYWEYPPLAARYRVPIVVTGFEPVDILRGIQMAVEQLEENRCEVENAYSRVVTYSGNQPAQAVIQQVFQSCDRKWRGIGLIPESGWCLRDEFADFNAELRFPVEGIQPEESPALYLRLDPSRAEETPRLPGIRGAMHA